jgi:hypothetical protein
MSTRGICTRDGEVFAYLDHNRIYDLNGVQTGVVDGRTVYDLEGNRRWLLDGDALLDLQANVIGYVGEPVSDDEIE